MTRQPTRLRPNDGTVDGAIRALGGRRNVRVTVMDRLTGRLRA